MAIEGQTPRISLVVPVRDEEQNLPELLARLAELHASFDEPFEVVAVDDGSRDGSPALLREAARRLPFLRVETLSPGGGMGAALLHGSQRAGGRYFVWCMADLSDRLADVAALVRILDEGHDLALASRAIPGGGYGNLGRFKSFGSRCFSRLARHLYRVPAHDLTNAFRGMTRELLFSLNLESRDFAISPEMVIRAHRAGARLAEAPTVYSFRRAGKSDFRLFRMGWKYLLLLWRLRRAGRVTR